MDRKERTRKLMQEPYMVAVLATDALVECWALLL